MENNPQLYSENELKDSLVVDKEGYICGYVESLTVDSNSIRINLYSNEIKNVEVPNEKELIRNLMEFVPRKAFSRGDNHINDLLDFVRDSLKLSRNEPVTLVHLMEYADTKDLKVPMRIEEKKVRVNKGSIEWTAVNKISFSELGKCILLNEPIEANKRNLAITDEVSFRGNEEVKGKEVVNSEGKMIGSVSKFLIGSPPGLLIRLEHAIGDARMLRYDTESLKTMLIPSRFRNEKELFAQVKKDLKLDSLNDYDSRALVVWAKRNNIDVQKETEQQRVTEAEIAISWDKLGKIGDVVILKEPLELDIESRIYNESLL